MRELEQLKERPELSVAALLALIHGHKQHKNPGDFWSNLMRMRIFSSID